MAPEDKRNFVIWLVLSFAIYGIVRPFIDSSLVSIPDIHTHVLVPILMFGAVCFLISLRRGLVFSNSSLAFIAYAVWISLSYLFSGIQDLFGLWAVFMIMILISAEMGSKNDLLLWFVISFGAIELVGIAVQIAFPVFHATKVATLFYNPESINNWAGSYGYAGFYFQVGEASLILIMAEGASLAKAFDMKQSRKWLYVVAAVVFFLGVALTGKRSTTMMALIIPVLMLVIDKQTRKVGLLLLASGMVLGIVAIGVLYLIRDNLSDNFIFGRLAKTFVGIIEGNDVSSSRIHLWGLAIEIFKGSPVFGSGVQTYSALTGITEYPHNVYFQVLCEQGIVGIALYLVTLAFIVFSIIRAYNRYDSKADLAFPMFVILEYILDSFVENSMTNFIEIVFMMIAVSILNAAIVRNEDDGLHVVSIPIYNRIYDKLFVKESEG